MTRILLCAACVLFACASEVVCFEEEKSIEVEDSATSASNTEEVFDISTEETSPRSRRSGNEDSQGDASQGRGYSYNDDPLKYKRSGDIFSAVKSKLKPKIGSLLSVSSPGHYHEGPPLEYGPPISYGQKSFNIWGFKKAIFGAIVQAVKAITGGVLALKGQLIKVKGHLVETKGKILQTKGEAISHFGRHVATKALLTPPHVPPSASSGGFSSSGYGHGPSHSVHEPINHGYPSPGIAYGPPPPQHPGPVALPPSGSGPGSYGPPPPPSGGGSLWGSGPSPPAPFSNSYGPPPHQAGIPAPGPGYGVPLPQPVNEYGPPPPGYGKPMEYGPPYKRDAIGAASNIPDGVQAGLLVLKPFKPVPSPPFLQAKQHNRRSMEYIDDDEMDSFDGMNV